MVDWNETDAAAEYRMEEGIMNKERAVTDEKQDWLFQIKLVPYNRFSTHATLIISQENFDRLIQEVERLREKNKNETDGIDRLVSLWNEKVNSLTKERDELKEFKRAIEDIGEYHQKSSYAASMWNQIKNLTAENADLKEKKTEAHKRNIRLKNERDAYAEENTSLNAEILEIPDPKYLCWPPAEADQRDDRIEELEAKLAESKKRSKMLYDYLTPSQLAEVNCLLDDKYLGDETQ